MKIILLIALLLPSLAMAHHSHDDEDDWDYYDHFYHENYNLFRYNPYQVPGTPFFFPIMGPLSNDLLGLLKGSGITCQTMSKPNDKGLVFSIMVCR